MDNNEVIVSLELAAETIRIGTLWRHSRNGKESVSFEYMADWLKHTERFSLEPALGLTAGTFHASSGFGLFGSIGDSAPDRWGRVLIRRAQNLLTNENKRDNRNKSIDNSGCSIVLSEIDYLLGVSDEARQGALRFSLPAQEEIYLAPASKSVIPPLVYLPKLLLATEKFIANDENAEDLRLLLAPGSSLGGARPKASVREQNGSLAIAKFPRKDDEFNVVLWEAVALTLAQKAGIKIPTWRLETVLDKKILIVKRFDRINNQRIPFLSAMSMLGAIDNERHSYLEIAYSLAKYGAMPAEDMAELWRRIVFTVMIANTDDHLRNHGFTYERYKGWRLSPAYDINPTPMHIKPRVLATSIDFDDSVASLDTAMSVANEFRISSIQAHKIIAEVKQAVKEWRSVAKGLGLSKVECDYMESAFTTE